MYRRNQWIELGEVGGEGFSLLEVLVSLAVVMLTLWGSMSVFINLSGATRYSRDTGEGIAVARSYLEIIMVQLKNGTAPSCTNNRSYPSSGCPILSRSDSCNFTKTTGNQSYNVFLNFSSGITSDMTIVQVYACWRDSGRSGKIEVSGSMR